MNYAQNEEKQGKASEPAEAGASSARFSEVDNFEIKMLLVEDNEDDIFLTRRAFITMPEVEVEAVSRGEDAIARLAASNYDVVVVDYKLPDMDGMELLARIAGPDLPVIMATGRGDQKVAVQALKAGAEDYLVKEDGYLRRLPQAVLGAVRRSRLHKENMRLLAQTTRQSSLLEAVLATDPGAIAVFKGPELRFELVNPSFRQFIAPLSKDDPVGKTLDEFLPQYNDSKLRGDLKGAFKSGKAVHLDNLEFMSEAGTPRYFRLHMLPLNPQTEEADRDIALIMWDNTAEVEARRKVEEVAQQAEAERAWLQEVINQMPEGVYIASADNVRTMLSNSAAERLLGVPPLENLSGYDVPQIYKLFNPDGSMPDVDELPLQKAIWKEESVVGRELLCKRPDGTEINLLLNSAPLYDANGKLVAGMVVFQDITGIKEAERFAEELAEQAEAQRAWLQEVINQMPSGVYIVAARTGELLFHNHAADELLGPPKIRTFEDPQTPEVFGARTIDDEPINVEETAIMQVLRSGRPLVDRQAKLRGKDGNPIYILSNTAPLFDRKGEMIAVVSVFQDITKIKEVERIKDEFISIASHELRTPLTSLKAAGQLMLRRSRQGTYAPQEVGLINTIVQQSDRMARLIEELLDVSRIQNGKMEFKTEEFDVSALAAETIESVFMSHQSVQCSLDSDGPLWVRADRDRIAQVFTNLLDNAIKYNRANRAIHVSVERDENQQFAVITVRDEGIGFEPDQSEQVFERFGRLGNVANHQKGMGLGLFICKQIIESHDGTIHAQSGGPGMGATFTATLPLAEKTKNETS